ncbi:DUF1329 domain-containing protein [Endozoicomonas sp. OPT23]|uniref:DUF1329 domain-containing protein n=1 Tax=Endozoicomonas sp. OPT23 TaxID=2072845 RepID=UPI00129B019E|nr:DUF1329 domain-containing protein [Endozoicomonas sp. OPT23]MRI33838.1 DUF1329 domain-containing protein [Endozoicomonas sp. OPT23]
MKLKRFSSFAASAALFTASAVLTLNAQAKVSAEEAARLGKDLTPSGAEWAGNKSGAIPAWNPDFKVPAEYKGSGSQYVDPYADETPLFTITAKNLHLYKNKLSEGQIALFETYPDTFKMPVYTTHRDGRYTDFVEKNIYRNALNSTLTSDGNGVVNSFGGVPFPIPKSGEEVMKNINLGGGALFSKQTNDNVMVYKDGAHLIGRTTTTTRAPYFDPELTPEQYSAEKMPAIVQFTENLLPVREKGKNFLIHEPVDLTNQVRGAWSYTPGTRRVRRAPNIAYDSPVGLASFLPVDSTSGFNGSMDRYNWKLIGKRELYIPYNNYKYENPSQDYKELFIAGHPNPEYARYELHRVWVVEANLKEGKRNVFKKRVLFIDEDSWVPSVVDLYNKDNQLWRVTLHHSINRYDFPGVLGRSGVYLDLISGEYQVDKFQGKNRGYPLNTGVKEMAYFKPSTLRKMGIR